MTCGDSTCATVRQTPVHFSVRHVGDSTFLGHLYRCAATVDMWLARVQQRRMLARLDDRLLRDVGISRAQAEAEARKPFWRP